MSVRHRIHTQVIELETGPLPVSGAGRWHRELEEFQQSRFLPALERALDAVAGEEATVVVDRLELELSWEEARGLRSVNFTGLDAQVERQVAVLEAVGKPPGGISGTTVPTGKETPPNVGELRQPLLHYLRTGRLPWSADVPPLPDPAPALRVVLIKEIKRLLADRPAVAGRLRHLQSLGAKSIYRQEVLAALVPEISEAPTRQLQRPVGTGPEGRGRQAAQQRQFTSPSEERRSVGQEVKKSDPPGTDPESPDADAVFLDGAGLVLLHPYVGWLLEETAATDDPSRAAALLHHAVWGEVAAAEWELPLIKLLLGLAPAELLIPAELTDPDRQVVDDLLTGVLEHWGALGSTGPDGLRANFLQRPGKLDAGRELTVERRAYDVLLDRLPWGVGLVKTGWMREVLRVNWV